MKQFGKILKFELKGYLRNKAFVGITIFLVVAIAIAMFIPNIVSAFKSDDEGARSFCRRCSTLSWDNRISQNFCKRSREDCHIG